MRSTWRAGSRRRRRPIGSRSSIWSVVGRDRPLRSGLLTTRTIVDELEAEAALDAQMAVGHRRIGGRRDLDDAVVLGVQGDCAADPAVRADRVGLRLRRLVPGAG